LPKSRFRLAAAVLLGALLATNLYRAATQSIVHDEALTWNLYLAGPVSDIFHYYSPNHHFLATVLFRISTTLFGDSEFAMRLPTLFAGAWFFWTVFRLCGLIFGDGWLFLTSCAVLVLNPILLDFLVAARGYGLAIAGLFWALFQMLSWFDDRSHGGGEQQLHKRLWKAALGCAIAVAANLTLLIPVFVIALTFCVLILRPDEKPEPAATNSPPRSSKARKKTKKARPEVQRQQTRSYAPLVHFVVPVIALALIYLLAAPIDLARTQDFYVGTSTALKSLRNLMDVSFAYRDSVGALRGFELLWSNLALIFLPTMVVAALIAALTTAPVLRSLLGLATLLSSLVVIGSAILLASAHAISGLPYPVDRTGIYFVPLASLAALGLARIITDRPGAFRWIGAACAAVLVSFALEFAAQWNVHSFLVWRYDADTKRIFEALEAAPKPPGPPESVRLGVSWVLEPALNYYRVVRKAIWLAPVMRDGFRGPRQFYVVTSEDQKEPSLPRIKEIYKGPVSGTILAIAAQ
jgi:hypothetical protein